MKALNMFLFPAHLEHPESTGRLDLFAHFGPVTESGTLQGGPAGTHVHTDLEIRHMITEMNRKFLYKIFNRPKETVETIVNEILPKAVAHHYTPQDIVKMFGALPVDDHGYHRFCEMQDLVLADQKRRLTTLIHGGEIQKISRKAIPYQTKPAQILQSITLKKKLRDCEAVVANTKRLHAHSFMVAPLEQQNISSQLAANVQLVRGHGSVSERWDRYCAVRRTGKTSYVTARNTARNRRDGDDDLGDKAPHCSTLTAACALNGPLERRC